MNGMNGFADRRLKTVRRGTMHQVTTSAGTSPSITLYACLVTRAPYDKNGKRYMQLDVSRALGDLDDLRRVDAFIAREATARAGGTGGTGGTGGYHGKNGGTGGTDKRGKNRDNDFFSPVMDGDQVVVKIPRDAVLDSPDHQTWLRVGDAVDVVLAPGAFAAFGYCLLLRRAKPHQLRDAKSPAK
jgi:hypothetical protein